MASPEKERKGATADSPRASTEMTDLQARKPHLLQLVGGKDLEGSEEPCVERGDRSPRARSLTHPTAGPCLCAETSVCWKHAKTCPKWQQHVCALGQGAHCGPLNPASEAATTRPGDCRSYPTRAWVGTTAPIGKNANNPNPKLKSSSSSHYHHARPATPAPRRHRHHGLPGPAARL